MNLLLNVHSFYQAVIILVSTSMEKNTQNISSAKYRQKTQKSCHHHNFGVNKKQIVIFHECMDCPMPINTPSQTELPLSQTSSGRTTAQSPIHSPINMNSQPVVLSPFQVCSPQRLSPPAKKLRNYSHSSRYMPCESCGNFEYCFELIQDEKVYGICQNCDRNCVACTPQRMCDLCEFKVDFKNFQDSQIKEEVKIKMRENHQRKIETNPASLGFDTD